jgi:hypothetical protein
MLDESAWQFLIYCAIQAAESPGTEMLRGVYVVEDDADYVASADASLIIWNVPGQTTTRTITFTGGAGQYTAVKILDSNGELVEEANGPTFSLTDTAPYVAIVAMTDVAGDVTLINGTAAQYDVGVVGTTIPLLNTDNTWDGIQQFNNYTLVGDENLEGQGIFLGAGFRTADDDKIWMYLSQDGITWGQIGGEPLITETVLDGARDPRILERNHKFYIAFTTCGFNNGTSFTIRETNDLMSTTLTAVVDFAAFDPTVIRVWSPQWFVDTDGSVNIVISLSSDGTNFELFLITATSNDLTTWSVPVPITGTLPANMIDGRIEKRGSTYYLWYKEETTDFIEYASSNSISSGYTVVESGDWAGWGQFNEGISLVKIAEDSWRIWFDSYLTNEIFYSDSFDNWATWTTKALINTPFLLSNPGFNRVRDVAALRTMLGATLSEQPVEFTSGAQAIVPSGLLYLGLATTEMTRHTQPTVPAFFPGSLTSLMAVPDIGVEGWVLNSNIVRNAALGNAWTCQNTAEPGWQVFNSWASDEFGIARAPATAGVAAFALFFYINSAGRVTVGAGSTPYLTKRIALATMAAGTTGAIADTSITAGSTITLSPGFLPLGTLYYIKTAGVGFTILSTNAADAGEVSWERTIL